MKFNQKCALDILKVIDEKIIVYNDNSIQSGLKMDSINSNEIFNNESLNIYKKEELAYHTRFLYKNNLIEANIKGGTDDFNIFIFDININGHKCLFENKII